MSEIYKRITFGPTIAPECGVVGPKVIGRARPGEGKKMSEATEETPVRRKPKSYRRHEREPRRRLVTIRFNDAELGEIREAAKRNGSDSVGAWVGTLASAVARGTEKRSVPKPMQLDREALGQVMQARGQMSSIGNNVNQIAAALNSGSEVPDVQVDALLAKVREIVNRLDDLTVQLVGRPAHCPRCNPFDRPRCGGFRRAK